MLLFLRLLVLPVSRSLSTAGSIPIMPVSLRLLCFLVLFMFLRFFAARRSFHVNFTGTGSRIGFCDLIVLFFTRGLVGRLRARA